MNPRKKTSLLLFVILLASMLLVARSLPGARASEKTVDSETSAATVERAQETSYDNASVPGAAIAQALEAEEPSEEGPAPPLEESTQERASTAKSAAGPRPSEGQPQYQGPTGGGGTPTSIQIPRLGVNALIVPVGLDPDGAMSAPSGPFEVGWYSPGAIPGGPGNVLLDGHVDWTDRQTGVPFGAVFWRLRELGQGDDVYMTSGDKQYRYTVEKVVTVSWDDPAGAQFLQPTATPTATLITCGGQFDRAARNYSHRVIVVARLAG